MMAGKHDKDNNNHTEEMEKTGDNVKVICLGDSAVGKSKYALYDPEN